MEMAADRNLDDLIKNEYGEYRKQLLKEVFEIIFLEIWGEK